LRTDISENMSAKGGYRLRSAKAERKVVLIGTGSEVAIAVSVAEQLEEKGIGADVVSMPSWERFDAQSASYKADVLPSDTLRVSVEAGTTMGWERYVGDGLRIGIDSFGASAPIDALYDHFGLTPDKITAQILAKLG